MVKEFNCKYIKLAAKVRDPNGAEREIHYFERKVDKVVIRAVGPDLKDEERVAYSVVRSLCVKLKIDPAEFGLVLG
jgi:hypothetical protein